MTNLANVENNVITDIIVGAPQDFPGRINTDGKPWGVGWITADGNVTFTQPAPIPLPNRKVLTRREFRQLFIANSSRNKYRRIETQAQTDDAIFVLWEEVIKAGEVDLDDQEVIDGLGALVPAVLNAAEKAAIMLGLSV